jgi:hypothetical protein
VSRHPGQRRSLNREQHKEIIRLRGEGLGWNRISAIIGAPASTVRNYASGYEPEPDTEPWDTDEQPYGPGEHKRAAVTLGLGGSGDLIPMSYDKDPFYAGTPAHRTGAQWFGQLWRDLGFPDGAHPRRVHYKADATGVTRPDGTVYRNCATDWGFLQKAAVWARTLGEVDVEAVGDKRGRGVAIHASAGRATGCTPGVDLLERGADDEWDGWRVPQAHLPYPGVLAMPRVSVTGYEYEIADQPVLIEVWPEKSTMDDILGPLSWRLGFNLVSGKGYESITHMVQLLRRAEQYPSRKAVVLYISDHDRAGQNMRGGGARHFQFWAAKLGIKAEVLVHPIVLTDEQVERYGLPKAPDSGATELDALEALHPGELERIVEAEVERWRDPELKDALADAGEDAREQARQAWKQKTGELSGELAAIRAEAEAIIAEYKPKIEELYRRLADGPGQRLADLKRRTAEAAEGDWELPDRPEAEDPEVPEGILYDSSRHWLDQLQAYRAHKGQPPLDLEVA